MTQVPWLGDTARPPAMFGTDTLVIVMSSTTTKFESASRPPAIHSGVPLMVEKSLDCVWAPIRAGSAMAIDPPRLAPRHVDVGVHRQAHAQRMGTQLGRIKRDPHRQSLHDLDPVAGGILRGNEREGGAGSATDTPHLAVVFDGPAVEVGGQHRRLSEAHLAQLRLFVVGIHVHRLDG